MELRVLEATVERLEEGIYYQCYEEGVCCGEQEVLVKHMTCFMTTVTPLVKVAT